MRHQRLGSRSGGRRHCRVVPIDFQLRGCRCTQMQFSRRRSKAVGRTLLGVRCLSPTTSFPTSSFLPCSLRTQRAFLKVLLPPKNSSLRQKLLPLSSNFTLLPVRGSKGEEISPFCRGTKKLRREERGGDISPRCRGATPLFAHAAFTGVSSARPLPSG